MPAYRHRAICLIYPTSALLVRTARSGQGHEPWFPLLRLTARYRLGKATFATTDGNGRAAPIADVA
jgi:hypothetical protein